MLVVGASQVYEIYIKSHKSLFSLFFLKGHLQPWRLLEASCTTATSKPLITRDFSKAERLNLIYKASADLKVKLINIFLAQYIAKSASVYDSPQFCFAHYHSSENHSQMGDIGRRKSNVRKETIFQVLDPIQRISSRDTEWQTEVSKSTFQHYFKRELLVLP